MKDKLLFYKIISRIFDPVVLTFFTYLLIANHFDPKFQHSLIILALQLIMPVCFYIMEVNKKLIDIDISTRVKRVPILISLVISQLLGILYINLLNYPEFMRIQAIILIINSLFLLITLFTKISAHALSNTLFISVLGIIFNPYYFLLGVPLIPLIFKARMVLHKHTINQLVYGTILGFSFIPMYLYL